MTRHDTTGNPRSNSIMFSNRAEDKATGGCGALARRSHQGKRSRSLRSIPALMLAVGAGLKFFR